MTPAQTQRLKSVASELTKGFSAPDRQRLWLVGGAVRNALLNRPVWDWDLCVDGDPLAVAQTWGRKVGARAFALDEERGTYRVAAKGPQGTRCFDFSRLQGRDLEADLARRDFSINAMAVSLADGGFVDPHQGLKDLSLKKIRGLSLKNFKDDPLRLLRGFRFSAELDFSLTPNTVSWVKKNRTLLRRSAAERVREEMFKIMATPRAADALTAMDRAGLLAVLLPEAEEMRACAHAYYGRQGVLGHSLAALRSFEYLFENLKFFFPGYASKLRAHLEEPLGGYPRFVLLKWGELFHDVGKPATAQKKDGKLVFYGHDYVGMKIVRRIAERFRFSNDQSKSLGRLVGSHMRPGNLGNQPVLTDRAIFRFYRDLAENAVGMLVLALADHFTYLSEKERRRKKDKVFLVMRKMISRYFKQKEVVVPPRIVDGHQLMRALKLTEGRVIGRLLTAIQEAQAEGRVSTRQEALDFAKTRLKALPREEKPRNV